MTGNAGKTTYLCCFGWLIPGTKKSTIPWKSTTWWRQWNSHLFFCLALVKLEWNSNTWWTFRENIFQDLVETLRENVVIIWRKSVENNQFVKLIEINLLQSGPDGKPKPFSVLWIWLTLTVLQLNLNNYVISNLNHCHILSLTAKLEQQSYHPTNSKHPVLSQKTCPILLVKSNGRDCHSKSGT